MGPCGASTAEVVWCRMSAFLVQNKRGETGDKMPCRDISLLCLCIWQKRYRPAARISSRCFVYVAVVCALVEVYRATVPRRSLSAGKVLKVGLARGPSRSLSDTWRPNRERELRPFALLLTNQMGFCDNDVFHTLRPPVIKQQTKWIKVKQNCTKDNCCRFFFNVWIRSWMQS